MVAEIRIIFHNFLLIRLSFFSEWNANYPRELQEVSQFREAVRQWGSEAVKYPFDCPRRKSASISIDGRCVRRLRSDLEFSSEDEMELWSDSNGDDISMLYVGVLEIDHVEENQNATNETPEHVFRWRRRNAPGFVHVFQKPDNELDFEEHLDLYERFKQYFPDSLFEYLAEETNKYFRCEDCNVQKH